MLTFAILERRKLRTTYLYRSSSVCITMSAKLVLGSISPVISSTFSICALMRSFIRSRIPSSGHLCDQASQTRLRRKQPEAISASGGLRTLGALGRIARPPTRALGPEDLESRWG